jgi:hypothetical protein
MKSAKGTIAVAAALLFALAGCGSSDTRSPMEQLIEVWGQTADLLNEMADAIGSIESQAAANAVALRIDDEFHPRMNALMVSAMDAFEAMSEEEQARLEEVMSENDEARVAMERMTRSGHRFDERSMRLEARFVTSALEESMLAFLTSLEQQGSRAVGVGGGGDTQPETGDAAWCQEMANKPEAQWTMNEALAFANQCVGR